MAEIDYLNQRTTNINIRISPMLKTQLIDSGARQGLNLSDYIMHVLTTEMSGGKKIDITKQEEYQNLWQMYEVTEVTAEKLQKEKENLQQQLKEYESLTKDYRAYVGQTIVLKGEKTEVRNHFEVLKAIIKCVNFKRV